MTGSQAAFYLYDAQIQICACTRSRTWCMYLIELLRVGMYGHVFLEL